MSDFLRQHHARQFNDIVQPFHTRMEAAFEDEAKLGDSYQAHVDIIAREMHAAETTLMKRLTEQAMSADDSKSCFMLD